MRVWKNKTKLVTSREKKEILPPNPVPHSNTAATVYAVNKKQAGQAIATS